MNQKDDKIYMSEWIDLVQNIAESRADKIPNGWLSISQIQKILKRRCKTTVCEIVNVLYAKKKVEKRRFRVAYGEKLRWVWHYKLINSKVKFEDLS